jgi:excisionase family DNA binding protein
MPGYNAAPIVAPGKILYRAEEAAAMMSLSRTAVFGLIKSGDLRTVKIGGRRRIPHASIENYVARLAELDDGAVAQELAELDA